MRRLSMTIASAALVVCVAASGTPALAGSYVGAAYVSTDSEIDVAADNFDPDDSGYKFFGGFNIIRFVGVEASYRDLGTFQASNTTNGVEADIEVWDVSARGILPLPGPVSVFARAGYANIMVDGTLTIDTVQSVFDEDDWEAFYGVGIELHFGSHLGLRLEWEEYDVDDDLNSLSVGAYFRF